MTPHRDPEKRLHAWAQMSLLDRMCVFHLPVIFRFSGTPQQTRNDGPCSSRVRWWNGRSKPADADKIKESEAKDWAWDVTINDLLKRSREQTARREVHSTHTNRSSAGSETNCSPVTGSNDLLTPPHSRHQHPSNILFSFFSCTCHTETTSTFHPANVHKIEQVEVNCVRPSLGHRIPEFMGFSCTFPTSHFLSPSWTFLESRIPEHTRADKEVWSMKPKAKAETRKRMASAKKLKRNENKNNKKQEMIKIGN